MHVRLALLGVGTLAMILAWTPSTATAQSERQILIDFYESTNGDDWYRNDGWLSEEDICSWEGIACFEGQIEEIRLRRNNITGPLSEALFELELLHDLALSGNNIQGTLPSAAINGLPLYDAEELNNEIFIDLSDNLLSGKLPTFTRQQGPGERVHINLAGNSLEGPVPASWVKMTLGSLDLSDNPIHSDLVDTWQSLPTARTIALAGAGLSGSFPEDPQRSQSNAQLTTTLRRLDLSRNQLQGEIPAWFADLSLQRLNLHHNQLSGEIPTIVDALSREDTVTLDLASNQFDGPIPESLQQVPLRKLESTHGGSALPPGLNLCWNDFDAPGEEMLDFIEARHHGGSYRNCQLARTPISPAFSGSRYDPDRNGEGFVQHVLENGQVLIFWFTYPVDNAGVNAEGKQAWFLDVVSPQHESLWLADMLQPTGRFGEGSNGFETPRFWLSIDAVDSANQQISYSREYIALRTLSGVPLYGLMSRRHEQEPLTHLAGTSCDSQQPHQWVAGAWYDPSRSGEGFMIDVTRDGQVVVYWFTYEPDTPSRQAWMIGSGEFVEGEVVIDEMIQPVGTNFGSGFDESEIEHIDWGSLTLEFDGQDSGHIRYESNLEEYGSGNYPIERLARPKLADCD